MAIRDQIQQAMTAALKAQKKEQLEALRYLFSQIRYKEIEAKKPLTDDEVTKLFTTEAKRRRESIDAYQKGGRQDLVDKEKFELSIIEGYLPKQLSDDELKAIVADVKSALSHGDFGTLMKAIMVKVAGKADGGRIAAMLKA